MAFHQNSSKLQKWIARSKLGNAETGNTDKLLASRNESENSIEQPHSPANGINSSNGGMGQNQTNSEPEILEILNGWQKINFDNGDYEGEVQDGIPHGFGRIVWKNGIAYHGEFLQQQFHGKGSFFFENGDWFEGTFVNHKPIGTGILFAGDRRFQVSYDGTKRLGEGANPTYLDENPVPEVISEESRIHLTAVSKGIKTEPFNPDYRHCKAVDAKLAFACPLRANEPLRNPAELDGRIAVVLRGGCSLAKKLRYCQRAGAVAMLVLGLDDDDKYHTVFQVSESAVPDCIAARA